jgi:hypothetical protein
VVVVATAAVAVVVVLPPTCPALRPALHSLLIRSTTSALTCPRLPIPRPLPPSPPLPSHPQRVVFAATSAEASAESAAARSASALKEAQAEQSDLLGDQLGGLALSAVSKRRLAELEAAVLACVWTLHASWEGLLLLLTVAADC